METRSNSVSKLYRLSNQLYRKRVPILPGIIMRIIRILFSCDIPYSLEIGENTAFAHNGLGVVVHRDAIIGHNNKIMQNVTIGGKNGQGPPKIGNYCFIGSGAKVMGEIEIGDDVMIGANAVVTKSVESGMVVAGVPAKVIGKTDPKLIGIFKG
jgi:serine O-acetyltransferase